MKSKHNMISVIVIAAIACIGTGCSRPENAAVSAAASAKAVEDRVLTVDEYLKQPTLRKKVFAACANDPGRKGRDPNCVNALQAERMSTSGTGRFPSVTP